MRQLNPTLATAYASLMFLVVAVVASALLWHSYESVGATLSLFIVVCALGSVATAWIVVQLAKPIPRWQATLFAALAPILGTLWTFILGVFLFKLQLTKMIPIEPKTLGGILVIWSPLWVTIAAITALIRRQRPNPNAS